MRLILETVARAALSALAAGLSELPKNDHLWAYTIHNKDTPYLTRVILPRVLGWRLMLHCIRREDHDPYPHNHPWHTAHSVVLLGAYAEERNGRIRILRQGDRNRLGRDDFHRIIAVDPGTWTAFLAGDRVGDWGFRVDGEFVEWREYFRRQGHRYDGVES